MAGTPLRNLYFFEKLCGKEFSKIVLTTTMWDDIDPSTGDKRERELQDKYWKSMIERGSSVRRFLSTPASALDLLRPILTRANEQRSSLPQQKMSVSPRKLKEIIAGRTLALQLEELVPRQQELLKTIRNDLLDAKLRPDQHEKLMQEYQGVSAKLQRAIKDVKRLKTSAEKQSSNRFRNRRVIRR
jgi:hypothetical protein